MTSKYKIFNKARKFGFCILMALLAEGVTVEATIVNKPHNIILTTCENKFCELDVGQKVNYRLKNEEPANISSGNTNQIVNYAYNFIGTPYVFGANGPNAFDCSSFTKYVYSYFRISIPRTSQEQYSKGAKIGIEDLQPGDLVFFNTYTNLGHVGIYIGDGDFIHASSTKGVTISSIYNEYYHSRYAGAVRY